MKTIKFVDFWDHYNAKNCPYFSRVLEEYSLSLCDSVPDILIYSVFGNSHTHEKYKNCTKVCYSAENLERFGHTPLGILNQGHYLISMERIDHDRYFRLSNMVRAGYHGCGSVSEIDDFSNIPKKTKFCMFCYGNREATYRKEFTRKLMRYKHIDCPGWVLNNMKIPNDRKLKNNSIILKPYKFNIAFENSSVPGYCTEKIWFGFYAKTISIYWGDPTISRDFNRGSFLNRHDYGSDDEFIDAIIELDNNDNKYYEMLTAPKIKDMSITDIDAAVKFFTKIV